MKRTWQGLSLEQAKDWVSVASLPLAILALLVSFFSLQLSRQERRHTRALGFEQRRQEVQLSIVESQLLIDRCNRAVAVLYPVIGDLAESLKGEHPELARKMASLSEGREALSSALREESEALQALEAILDDAPSGPLEAVALENAGGRIARVQANLRARSKLCDGWEEQAEWFQGLQRRSRSPESGGGG